MRRMPLFRRLFADTRGTTMVELAFAIPLFLLIVFGAIDFARFFFHFVATEKALADSARTASVRPAICPDVPDFNRRGALTSSRLGTSCTAGGTVCADITRTCTLAETGGSTATADEIWNRLTGSLPINATRSNIRITYAFDPALNFLGGPFVPNVLIEVENLDFNFATPIRALAQVAGATSASFDGSPAFPSLRAVAPGEDLAAGTNG